MKTYKFYIDCEYDFLAPDIRVALSQLKKKVGLKFYSLKKIYLVNNKVRYFKDDFIASLEVIRGEFNDQI